MIRINGVEIGLENVKTNGAQELTKNPSKYQVVQASKIRRSTILPQRIHGEIIAKSVQQMGILQPLIVRPLSGCSDEYELIDGLGRFEGLEKDQMVQVKIVDASDIQSFRISNATYQRKDQTVLDRALFFQAWLQAIIKEKGTKNGAQAELVKNVGCSEGLISQYLAVSTLFEKLKSLNLNWDFSTLKTMDLNRLYQLSMLVESPHLSEVALELENKPDMPLTELKAKVEYTRTSQDVTDGLNLIGDDCSTTGESSPAETLKKKSEATQQKLTHIVSKAIQNLSEVSDKLSLLMLEIESNTEKYASTEAINTVSNVLKLLSKLQACTVTLTRMAPTSARATNINADQDSTSTKEQFENIA